MKFKLTLAFALLSALAHAATTPPTVVFIGDQFTNSWANTPGAFPSNWVNKGLKSCSDPCYDGTAEFTEGRFQTDVIDLHPAIVHIMVGIDDADTDDDATQSESRGDYLTALQSMIKMAKAANIQVILGLEWTDLSRNPYNAITATLGAQSGVTVINYADALCGCVNSAGALGVSVPPSPNQYTTQTGPDIYGYALMSQLAETAIATINLSLTGGYLQNYVRPNDNIGEEGGTNINTVYTGSDLQFTAYGEYAGIAAQPQLNTSYTGSMGTWTSSNPFVMYVNQFGQAYAISAGSATITFTPPHLPSGVRFHTWVMTVQ